jgi:ribosomal protein L11 methyltransferase
VIRLAVRCRAEMAEAVLTELLELAPNGVEEDGGPGWVEYAIYGSPGEVPDVGDLQVAAGGGIVEVSTSAVPDDWADRWRDFHRPVVVADRLVVRPSWQQPAGRWQAEVEVLVDPGQAFGTGAHATTRMCLELLLELADRREATGGLTDLGTGSGVLAIAGATLGWAPVAGYDHELAALEAAAGNAKANGVDLALQRVNLREGLPALAPTGVANLTAPLLVAVAERLSAPLPRWLVASGMLREEVGQVEEAFARMGLAAAERRESGDWAAVLLAGRVDRDIHSKVDHHRRSPS